MPACLTHNLFAKDVLEKLNEPGLDSCAYAWGAQGPDFLFCHRRFKTMRGKTLKTLQEYGSALHKTSPSRTLGAMREFVGSHSDPIYPAVKNHTEAHISMTVRITPAASSAPLHARIRNPE